MDLFPESCLFAILNLVLCGWQRLYSFPDTHCQNVFPEMDRTFSEPAVKILLILILWQNQKVLAGIHPIMRYVPDPSQLMIPSGTKNNAP